MKTATEKRKDTEQKIHRLTESGNVRFVGMSSHNRPLFGQIVRGEVKAPVDFFQIRYNAVHSGAEPAGSTAFGLQKAAGKADTPEGVGLSFCGLG